jgi:hypothetical protein
LVTNALPADLTGAVTADVLEERRLELAFEGIRWYDIVRRKWAVLHIMYLVLLD